MLPEIPLLLHPSKISQNAKTEKQSDLAMKEYSEMHEW